MKTIIQKITSSAPSYSQLILRLTFAIVLWPHGAQLLLGWFGGPGFKGSMRMFGAFGLSPVIAFLVITIQFFGSLFILTGFLTRLVSIAAIILFMGMILKAHLQVGFFMNWAGTLKGEGYEYHILVIGILLVLTIFGAGKWGLDNLLAKEAN